MEARTKNKTESPTRSQLDNEAYRQLVADVNESGNRTMAKVLEKPFPILKAQLDRFNEIVRNMPPDVQKSPGIAWLKVDAFLTGLAKELGVGMADAIWDVATSPINIFVPKLRHPTFKRVMTELYTPPIVGKTYGDQIRLWFTPSGGTDTAKGADLGLLNSLSVKTTTTVLPRQLSA